MHREPPGRRGVLLQPVPHPPSHRGAGPAAHGAGLIPTGDGQPGRDRVEATGFPYPNTERFLLLLNPHASGRGSSGTLRRRVAAAFADRRVPFDIEEPESASRTMELSRRAAAAGFRAVVAVGGDGTVAAALRGTAGTEVPVAILPFGTGNQLASNFGIPRSLEGSVGVAVDGRPMAIDLGRIGDAYFALIAGAGLDAEVMAGATEELKERLGFGAYLLAGLKAGFKNLVTPNTADFRIRADGDEIEVRATMVLLANVGQLAAGPLVEVNVGPGVSFQDGLIDVCIFAPRNLPEAAAMVWKVARKEYGGDDRMIFLQAERVRVESDPPVAAQIDGEPAGETPVEATVDPLAGRILVPR